VTDVTWDGTSANGNPSSAAPNLTIDRDLRVFYQVLAEQIRANFSRSEVILFELSRLPFQARVA